MATTTATINITSDIPSTPIIISNTMTMTKDQSLTGLEETTGLRTKKFGTVTTAAVIAEHDELTDDKAHKMYIRNTSASKTNYFFVAYNASAAAATTTEIIGKLHGGDWMLFPYNGNVNIVFADGIVVATGQDSK